MPDFVGSYDQYFDVRRADTRDRLDAAYRLRYQVYCIENQFEDPGRCPDGREIDEDDDRAVHTLLVHRASGAAIGTARLILPRPDTGRPLPIERVCDPGARALIRRLPRHNTAEVSRFAVSKQFRRRQGEERHADAGFPDPVSPPRGTERRLLPHITFGLLRGILELCRDHQITVLAAVMEPALLRILSRLGLDFDPVGPLVDYHGPRQPCLADIAGLARHSRDRACLLWGYLEASGAAAALPATCGLAPGWPPLPSP
jgi:N-acyl amino acid synthase of PEP-CTERM/exosortase system